jgi:hypothetical protein
LRQLSGQSALCLPNLSGQRVLRVLRPKQPHFPDLNLLPSRVVEPLDMVPMPMGRNHDVYPSLAISSGYVVNDLFNDVSQGCSTLGDGAAVEQNLPSPFRDVGPTTR